MSASYTIETNFGPEELSAVGLAIYKAWVDFAMGRTALNGFKIAHPTGRYAAAIRAPKQEGPNTVTIMVDSTEAPEATYLEEGHQRYDLKERTGDKRTFRPNRNFGTGTTARGHTWRGAGSGPLGAEGGYIQARAARGAGWASIPRPGPGVDPESWVIPAMPAYSPAKHLADLFRAQYGVK